MALNTTLTAAAAPRLSAAVVAELVAVKGALTPEAGGGAPAGYTLTTLNGVPVTNNGRTVFDNGFNLFYEKAA